MYRLPEEYLERTSPVSSEVFLIGTDTGLFKILPSGIADPLWTEGKVERILKTPAKWFFVTEKGIFSSADLKEFTQCNTGLPSLVVKQFEGGEKKLVQRIPLLKDICADPFDPDILVTATKDEVFLTRNGGASWTSIGSASRYTSGMKAVAVSHMPVYGKSNEITGTELVVFMSHPIYGLSYCRVDEKNPKWVDVSAGFSAMPSLTQVDEISDILPVLCRDSYGSVYTEIYLSQSFIPNIYRFDWKSKKGVKVFQGENPCDAIDGLFQNGSSLVFSTLGKILSLSLSEKTVSEIPSFETWREFLTAAGDTVNSAYVPSHISGLDASVILNELWLLNPDTVLSPWAASANKKKAVYASVYQLRNSQGIEKYKKIISDNRLNSVVIDMKDDYGLLRFEPESELLKQKGKVTQYKIDVKQVVDEFKKDGVYLIARIVVFKDRNLAAYNNGKYAVWNSATNKPWVGIRGTESANDGSGQGTKTVYYDENWVDPYSEEVWEYNVEIARELVSRGFDEIQFDYIRFPTDGTNLNSAVYRWKDNGMVKEGALVSFLSYARKNINAPIGIDIYGANGWYRSGTRTGQDVELMSEYVDVVCPMFYPSHFEQDFLEYPPNEERAYRIYFYGSFRNTVIGRNRIIVRPWVQAFYMGVRHDKKYYDKNYVLREIFGVRDGLDRGYMHWNNSGGYYEDISPDPLDTEISPWHANECDLQKRIPAFSKGEKKFDLNIENLNREKEIDMISIWNSVMEREIEYEGGASASGNFLHVKPGFGGRR
ncbi:putative glycoside hydrolase [Treponema sp.]|uniref:putative glycoside hydrolase n=1 Tax=Treponema sp. TaxID=166 RepID=UPI003F082E38